jgi:hypothetical protein
MFVLGERDQYSKRLEGAREAVQKVDQMVEIQVKAAL